MQNISILFFSVLTISVPTEPKLDYYWKDFDGHNHIPKDAFVGYVAENPIYIGQGYFKNSGILPATIYHNLSTLTVAERGRSLTITKNIKILCTQNSNAFQWISVYYDDIKTIQNISFLRIVEAGTESDAPLYVGRHYHEGTMQIAKVYNVQPFEGLTIPNKRGEGTYFRDFELLVYCTIC